MEKIEKSTVSTDKLDALADKFKVLTKQNKKFTLAEMIEANVKVELQNKEIIPTKEVAEIKADENYDGLGTVVVKAIPSEYIIPSGTKELTESGEYDVTQYAKVNITAESGRPIEVDSAEEMDSLLNDSNIGKVYKYTGPTTESFINNEIYIIVNEVE